LLLDALTIIITFITNMEVTLCTFLLGLKSWTLFRLISSFCTWICNWRW
jgi:hypothetical protein